MHGWKKECFVAKANVQKKYKKEKENLICWHQVDSKTNKAE